MHAQYILILTRMMFFLFLKRTQSEVHFICFYYNFLEQKDLAFSGNIVPLSVAILCAEPRHIMIFTVIGAKGGYFCF
jgi:hypothetical protein